MFLDCFGNFLKILSNNIFFNPCSKKKKKLGHKNHVLVIFQKYNF